MDSRGFHDHHDGEEENEDKKADACGPRANQAAIGQRGHGPGNRVGNSGSESKWKLIWLVSMNLP